MPPPIGRVRTRDLSADSHSPTKVSSGSTSCRTRSSTTRTSHSSTRGKVTCVLHHGVSWFSWRQAYRQDAQIAFVFTSEAEAHDFYKKVANRSKYASECSWNDVMLTCSQSEEGEGGQGRQGGEGVVGQAHHGQVRQVPDLWTCELSHSVCETTSDDDRKRAPSSTLRTWATTPRRASAPRASIRAGRCCSSSSACVDSARRTSRTTRTLSRSSSKSRVVSTR